MQYSPTLHGSKREGDQHGTQGSIWPTSAGFSQWGSWKDDQYQRQLKARQMQNHIFAVPILLCYPLVEPTSDTTQKRRTLRTPGGFTLSAARRLGVTRAPARLAKLLEPQRLG
jgi:hypothetical protein